MVPGVYQRIDINVIQTDGVLSIPAGIRVNTNAESGLRPGDMDFQTLPLLAQELADPNARVCPVADPFTETTATDECIISSYNSGIPYTASSTSFGIDSSLTTAVSITEEDETLLFSVSETLGFTEFSVFRCPTPLLRNGRIVCSECLDSSERRCNGFVQ